MSEFIPISSPEIGEDEKRAVLEVLESGVVAQGPVVSELENRFAEYCGSDYAVALNSGTAAIHTALHVADVGPGDTVITTPFSFIATVNPIIMQGANVRFVDIRPDTFNIDTDLLQDAHDPSAKAVIAVDLFGQPCDYEAIWSFAREHDLVVIEDACQSIGATYKGYKAGKLGSIACFSLYATKNIMSAEGGVITTDNKEYAESAKSFRQHGMVGPYEYADIGYNYRTTDILAAIALVQLKKVDRLNKTRIRNAERLTEGIGDVEGLVLPHVASGNKSVFHQFTIRVTEEYPHTREELMTHLRNRGIGSGIYYPKPLHLYPHIKQLGFARGDFPVAEKAAEEVLSLPVHPGLGVRQIDRIIKAVREVSGV